MKTIKFFLLVVCAVMAACSGTKKTEGGETGSGLTPTEVAGYYIGTNDFEAWSCCLNDDGTGYEMAKYSTGAIQITMPFTWTLQDGEVTFTFLPDEVLVECGEESDVASVIISSALAGYSEPRVCSVSKKDGKIFIDGEELYPTFEQINIE